MMVSPLPLADAVVAQVRAVRNGVGWAWRDDLGVLRIEGPDAAAFLQNRTTQDVAALRPGQGQWNAVLDKGAHLQGLFTLHAAAEGYLAVAEREALPEIEAAMAKYRIIEQVTFRSLGDGVRVLALTGRRLLDWLAAQGLPEAAIWRLPPLGVTTLPLLGREVIVLRRSLTGETGWLLLWPAEADPQALMDWVSAAHGGLTPVALSPEAGDVLRVEAGQIRAGVDFTAQTLLPETGWETQSVSYTKGCFLGQETVARVRTYGAVQRGLTGLTLPAGSPVPTPGPLTSAEGQPLGTGTSAVDSPTLGHPVALAYLGKTDRVPGQALSVTINGQAVTATVTSPPFVDPTAEAKRQLAAGLARFAESGEGVDADAMVHLEAACTLDPTLADAVEALGVLYSRAGRYEAAVAQMHRLLALDPERAMAHTNLSIYYLKLGDKNRAEEEKAKATVLAMRLKAREAGLTPPDAEAERRRQQAALRERIQLFQEALALQPDDPLGNFGLGSAYFDLGEPAQAVAPLRRAITGQPNHTVAYLTLGKCLEATGDRAGAADVYRQGVAVAARRGDRMPLAEMEQRLQGLGG